MGSSRPLRRIVLVVEDDADQRALASLLFEESEFDVVECASAEAALAVMQRQYQRVAMIFTDVRLAGAMDGVELVRIVRERFPNVPAIVTSGAMGDREIPGNAVFIPKPWRALDLLMAAEKLRIATDDPRWNGDIF